MAFKQIKQETDVAFCQRLEFKLRRYNIDLLSNTSVAVKLCKQMHH